MGAVIKGNSSGRQPPAWIVRRDAKAQGGVVKVAARKRVPRHHGTQSDYLTRLSRAELVAHCDGILAGTVQVAMGDVPRAGGREGGDARLGGDGDDRA
jgi:hypothetical protein